MNREIKDKSQAFELALKAVEAFEEIDMVLVPTHASPDMLNKTADLTGLPVATLRRVYALMIQIAQERA